MLQSTRRVRQPKLFRGALHKCKMQSRRNCCGTRDPSFSDFLCSTMYPIVQYSKTLNPKPRNPKPYPIVRMSYPIVKNYYLPDSCTIGYSGIREQSMMEFLYFSAVDHTASKTPDPIRTPQLSDARPGQYWAGGPPGNAKELTAFWPNSSVPDSGHLVLDSVFLTNL